jgi:hypothetical protein
MATLTEARKRKAFSRDTLSYRVIHPALRSPVEEWQPQADGSTQWLDSFLVRQNGSLKTRLSKECGCRGEHLILGGGFVA